MASENSCVWHDFGRRAAIALLAGVVWLQSGCAVSPSEPKPVMPASLGRVMVVAELNEPDIAFKGFTHGKGEGAAKTAGSTFANCMGSNGSCSGELCGAVVILQVVFCGVASGVGGIVGAVKAPSAKEAQASESTLITAIDSETIQTSLRNEVVDTAEAHGTRLVSGSPEIEQAAVQAHDYRSLTSEGADTILQVGLTSVGTEGKGINGPLLLYMKAHIRLVRSSDNAELYYADYDYEGKRITLAEWSSNGAQPLLDGLDKGYETLGMYIYDQIFRLYPFPDRQAWAAGRDIHAFGLGPIYPRNRGVLTGDPIFGNIYEWTTIDSLQPTLRWESFPRPVDIKVAPEEMARVKNVRYDLLIARERNLAPAEIVYRREGLPTAEHTIETRLQHDARYFWTVRATFELDGRQRVTEWGVGYNYLAFERHTAPSRWSYRFKTK